MQNQKNTTFVPVTSSSVLGKPPGEIRRRVRELCLIIDRSYGELAEILYHIREEELYRKWGYTSWKSYIQEELDMRPRKTQYLISIWNFVVQSPPEVSQKVLHLGWTKARELVGIVNEENVDEWVAKAKDLPHARLVDEIQAARKGQPPSDTTLQNVVFRLYPDQYEAVCEALERAMEIANTEVKSHALSLIAAEFLSSNMPVRRGEPPMFLKKLEALLGLRFIAVDRAGEVVWGKDLVKEEPSEAEDSAKK